MYDVQCYNEKQQDAFKSPEWGPVDWFQQWSANWGTSLHSCIGIGPRCQLLHCCKVCIGYCQKCAYKYSGEYIATHRIVHWAVKRWEETSILASNAIYYNVHLLHCTLGTLGSTMNQCSAPKLSVHKQHIVHCTLGIWHIVNTWTHCAHLGTLGIPTNTSVSAPGAARGSTRRQNTPFSPPRQQCSVFQCQAMWWYTTQYNATLLRKVKFIAKQDTLYLAPIDVGCVVLYCNSLQQITGKLLNCKVIECNAI